MHDPMSVAFEIYLGKQQKKNGKYRSPFITIWHVDPETDGTDDSCGWFIRQRHVDKNVLEKIVKEFEHEWDGIHRGENGYIYSCGWFHPNGSPNHSVQGIVFNMYLYAAKIALIKSNDKPRKAWDAAWKFMRKYLVDIMYFAENNRDSMSDTITRKFQIGTDTLYTEKSREEMIKHCAAIVYTDILRKKRKWYQHPRWHIHHWKIVFHPFRDLKRRYWDKCCICGKRGFKSAAMSDWYGTKRWHQECDDSRKQPTPLDQNLKGTI